MKQTYRITSSEPMNYLCFMTRPEQYMRRCIELAKLGAGSVSPNPMVGAVLVHNERIIGEGWHKAFGGPHAEVHCIQSVVPENQHLIRHSELYVSLEPCSHTGKTPPCTNLILSNKIVRVFIGCSDPFPAVNGSGITKLREEGIDVIEGVLESQCQSLNKRFFTFVKHKRPFIILKWAQTCDGYIGSISPSGRSAERLIVSNPLSDRLVHRMRAHEDAILIGATTANNDNPKLTTRLWPGRSPKRIVIDPQLRLKSDLNLFDGTVPTIVLNFNKDIEKGGLTYMKVEEEGGTRSIVNNLYSKGIQSLIVEGGAKTTQAFIDADCWDEAVIITNNKTIGEGIQAPALKNAKMREAWNIASDLVTVYQKESEGV